MQVAKFTQVARFQRYHRLTFRTKMRDKMSSHYPHGNLAEGEIT